MPPPETYAIIGGGLTGLTLAIALHHRNVPVKIYEQAPSFGEIGAGVAFTPNAVQAMQLCHPGVREAFERVRTRNLWESKREVWFDYYDGYHVNEGKGGGEGEGVEEGEKKFEIVNGMGNAGVHRARFLDELVKLLPEGVAEFGKRLVGCEERGTEGFVLKFEDGSTATAGAVLGCDGIKSRVRQLLFGEDPCVYPTYSQKYAYRALVPMEDAVRVLGREKAENSCMHMGPSGHVLTFPINHGELMNVVAFRTTSSPWPESERLTTPATREDALKDFADFAPYIRNLLKLAKPELDIWGIFHLADHPLPTYTRGRICLLGDAAHASSPHHGAGAGMGIEDCAVMASLLAPPSAIDCVEDAFAVFDSVRRERTQWLVQSSAHIGDCYEWIGEGVGEDVEKVEAEIKRRNAVIAEVDVEGMCVDARARLERRGAKLA